MKTSELTGTTQRWLDCLAPVNDLEFHLVRVIARYDALLELASQRALKATGESAQGCSETRDYAATIASLMQTLRTLRHQTHPVPPRPAVALAARKHNIQPVVSIDSYGRVKERGTAPSLHLKLAA